VIVCNEVEYVFLEVRARTTDGVHLVLADHLGEQQAEFGGTHRPGQRHHHLPATLQLRQVAVGRVDYGRGVEVAIVVLEKRRNSLMLHGLDLLYVRSGVISPG
jgi:hypothetical protein